MLFAVAVIENASGLRALAPQLPDCEVAAATEQEALPKLRLAIEARVTEICQSGTPMPAAASSSPARQWPELATARWVNLHINVAHLEALARHQRGR